MEEEEEEEDFDLGFQTPNLWDSPFPQSSQGYVRQTVAYITPTITCTF